MRRPLYVPKANKVDPLPTIHLALGSLRFISPYMGTLRFTRGVNTNSESKAISSDGDAVKPRRLPLEHLSSPSARTIVRAWTEAQLPMRFVALRTVSCLRTHKIIGVVYVITGVGTSYEYPVWQRPLKQRRRARRWTSGGRPPDRAPTVSCTWSSYTSIPVPASTTGSFCLTCLFAERWPCGHWGAIR